MRQRNIILRVMWCFLVLEFSYGSNSYLWYCYTQWTETKWVNWRRKCGCKSE